MRRFWESMEYVGLTNQVVYTDPTKLPAPIAGAIWHEDEDFDERKALYDDPELAEVFARA
jgi:hypothetical protein